VSYQPEERYWTDYLRIALPVVGLLLMLGLFWFWAASLIGDEDDENPANVASNLPTATPTAPPAPSAPPGGAAVDPNQTETPAPATDGGEADANAPAAEGGNIEDPAADAAETPEGNDGETVDDPPATDEEREPGEFRENDIVVTTSAGVRLRSDPELSDPPEANLVRTLDDAEELTVTGDSVTADDGTVWVPVESSQDDSGYVAAELIILDES